MLNCKRKTAVHHTKGQYQVARKANVRLEDLPNIGPRMAADLRRIGILIPSDLRSKDPLKLYFEICQKTGMRQDPCVLDTMMAVVDYVRTQKPKKWWVFTPRRKVLLKARGIRL